MVEAEVVGAVDDPVEAGLTLQSCVIIRRYEYYDLSINTIDSPHIGTDQIPRQLTRQTLQQHQDLCLVALYQQGNLASGPTLKLLVSYLH